MAAALVAALAATSMAGAPATAQSSTALYGVLDLSLTGTHRDDAGSSLGLQSGVQSGSRWGLRGTHELGGGLRADFVLESGVIATTGRSAQGSRLFGRAAWLGLSGPAGQLRAGRQTSVSSAVLADFDPFLASYLITGAQTSLQPFNANRNDNTLAYWSPAVGGWRVALDYSFDHNDDGVAASDGRKSRVASAALVHQRPAGALALTVEAARWGRGGAHDQAMVAAGGRRDPYALTVAGRWQAGPATLYGAGSLMRHGSTVPAVQWPGQAVHYPGSSVLGLMAGLSWQIGAGSALLSWQTSRPDSAGALGRRQATHTQQVLSVGYAYSLSKRTGVYAVYGYMDGAWHDPRWRETQYAVGLRQRF